LTVADTHVGRCLAAIRERSGTIAGVIAPLSKEAWHGSTNCPPWRVADLASHIVSSGQGFVRSIRRGLDGIVEPGPSSPVLAEPEPATVATALEAVTNEFESLYDGLSDAQLETICFHRRGNRSIRWYAAHRLAEVSFHGWDLDVSLGRPAALSAEVAQLLLPTLLESNVPRTYAAGLSDERGAGERFLLVAADDPATRWLVTVNAETLEVVRGGTSSEADLVITAAGPNLALLSYGRVTLPALIESGACAVEGDAWLVERFGRIFPRP
jgi:uncharacterized protein (TIGR03083 family)